MNKGDIKNIATGALGLLTLTLAMFFDLLFLAGDAVLSNEKTDLAFQFVHWRAFGFGEMLRGNLPLWNPHIYCGAPFLAGFQSALLYPLNVLYLILPLAKAINWSIALHAFLGGFFFYLWAVKRGLHPLACFLAGAEFIFCAPHFLHIYAGHLPNLCTMIWAPLLFLAIDGIFECPSMPWCLLGTAAVSLMILAGHIQYAYYTGIAASIYLLVRLPWASDRWKTIGCFIIVFAGGAVLAAAQVLPGLDAGRDTLRGAGVSYSFAARFSLPPENLITWLVPGFFGDMTRFPYWGRWYLWEMSLFVSVTGFLLALYAVVFLRDRERLIPAAMAVILLLVAMGSYLPWFPLLHEYLPGFDRFRGVSKFVFHASLFVILLSAMGLDRLVREGLERRWPVFTCPVVIAGLSLAADLAIRQSASSPSGWWVRLMHSVFNTGETYQTMEFFTNGEIIRQAAAFASQGLVVLSIICTGIAGILFLRISDRRKASLLVFLAIAELFFAASSSRETFPLSAAYPRDVISFFNSRPGDHRISNAVSPDLAMSMGWRDIWGYDPMIPRRYGELTAMLKRAEIAVLNGGEWPFYYPNLLKILGCRYMLVVDGERATTTELIGDILPRALLVDRWVVEPDQERALSLMSRPDFDPRRIVILERDPNLAPVAGGENPGTVKVTETSTDHLILEAEVEAASILVVTDNYMEGWRITPLAGTASSAYEIIPANHTLRGVPLAPGRHHIRMEYRPIAFVVGVWISLASVAAWVFLAGRCIWHRRKSGGAGEAKTGSVDEVPG